MGGKVYYFLKYPFVVYAKNCWGIKYLLSKVVDLKTACIPIEELLLSVIKFALVKINCIIHPAVWSST